MQIEAQSTNTIFQPPPRKTRRQTVADATKCVALRMWLQDLYLNPPRQRGRLLIDFLSSCESKAV